MDDHGNATAAIDSLPLAQEEAVSAIDKCHACMSFQRASFGGQQDLRGEVWRAVPLMADSDLSNASALKGKVAIVSRGYVTFDEKARRVQCAGAVGMIVLNWANNVQTFDALSPAGDDITIPIVCIRQDDGSLLPDGCEVALTGDGITPLQNHEDGSCFEGIPKKSPSLRQFSGFLEHAEFSWQIEGVLGMDFSTLREFDEAVRMFDACMLSWQERAPFEAILSPASSDRESIISSHAKHLAEARRTRRVLADLETCNESALDLIRDGHHERAATSLSSILSELHDVECDLRGRDSLRISVFEIPQRSYKILQQALLADGLEKNALAVATIGKARSLAHMLDQNPKMSPAQHECFSAGDRVRLKGLKVRTHYNGRTGVVDQIGETILVDVEGEPEALRVAPRNLVLAANWAEFTDSLQAYSADLEKDWRSIQEMVKSEDTAVVEYSWLLGGDLLVWVISREGELQCCKKLTGCEKEIHQLIKMTHASMGVGGEARAGDTEGETERCKEGLQLVDELVLQLHGKSKLSEDMQAVLDGLNSDPVHRKELEDALEECGAVRSWLDRRVEESRSELTEAIQQIQACAISWNHLKTLASDQILRDNYAISDPLVRAELWEMVSSHLDEFRLLRELHKLLIEPVLDSLAGAAEILLLPHEILFAVPWAALMDARDRYLVELCAVRVAPSLRVVRSAASCPIQGDAGLLCSKGHELTRTATSQSCSCNLCAAKPHDCKLWSGGGELFLCEQCGTDMCSLWGRETQHGLTAVVVGNPWPHSHGGFLKHAGDEAASVYTGLQQLGCFDRVEVATKSRAVKSWVKQRLGGAAWAHFACHASQDGASLILASCEEEDEELTMREVQQSIRLRQGACVVLSACNTGRGAVTPDGVVGISRAFLLAGAGAAVVSLWNVGDESTKLLMARFYELLEEGKSVPQALQHAMLEFARGRRTAHGFGDGTQGIEEQDSDDDVDDEMICSPILPTMCLLQLQPADARSALNGWGKKELKGLELLFNDGEGFCMNGRPVALGNGINQRGYITQEACQLLFGVRLYSQVWGEHGTAVMRASLSETKDKYIKQAIVAIQSSVTMRVDLRDRLGGESGHDFILSQLKASARRMKDILLERAQTERSCGAEGVHRFQAEMSPKHWAGFVIIGARTWLPVNTQREQQQQDGAHAAVRLSCREVGKMLEEMELGQYVDSFADNGIDSGMFDELGGLWDDLGVTKRAHQIKILKRFGLR